MRGVASSDAPQRPPRRGRLEEAGALTENANIDPSLSSLLDLLDGAGFGFTRCCAEPVPKDRDHDVSLVHQLGVERGLGPNAMFGS